MLFLDGVYVDRLAGSARFHWVSAPTNQALTRLSQTIARRVGRYLERQGLLERDAENSCLTTDAVSEEPINVLLDHSITYRIALGLQAGRKVLTLRTLPACEPDDDADSAGKVSGFALHAGVSARADEGKKLERLCRYISRPAVSERRLSLTPGGNSKHRAQVTPSKRGKRAKLRINGDERSPVEQHAAMTWAQRLKRVFNIDITTCEECGGTVKVIAAIEDPAVIKQNLAHLERKAASKEFNPLAESRAPPQVGLFG